MNEMIGKAIALLLGGVVVGACSSAPRSEAEILDRRVTVEVDNQSFSDMTIYVVRGQRIRLGSARGLTKTVFTIPPSVVGGVASLRFIADPIGTSRASVSEEITITEGDSIGLTIPPP